MVVAGGGGAAPQRDHLLPLPMLCTRRGLSTDGIVCAHAGGPACSGDVIGSAKSGGSACSGDPIAGTQSGGPAHRGGAFLRNPACALCCPRLRCPPPAALLARARVRLHSRLVEGLSGEWAGAAGLAPPSASLHSRLVEGLAGVGAGAGGQGGPAAWLRGAGAGAFTHVGLSAATAALGASLRAISEAARPAAVARESPRPPPIPAWLLQLRAALAARADAALSAATMRRAAPLALRALPPAAGDLAAALELGNSPPPLDRGQLPPHTPADQGDARLHPALPLTSALARLAALPPGKAASLARALRALLAQPPGAAGVAEAQAGCAGELATARDMLVAGAGMPQGSPLLAGGRDSLLAVARLIAGAAGEPVVED